MSAVNWADEEGRHEQIWADDDTDRPDLADVIDIHSRRPPEWPKICAGSWSVKHETPAEIEDCRECLPGWDEPPC